jgi:hypothetical protein
MNKKTLAIILGLTLNVISFSAALAAGISLSPAKIETAKGKDFEVTIMVDPQSETIYTAKVELRFPAELVSAATFVPASGWLPLTQPGYDSLDNAGGLVIKTGGYAGGIGKPTAFGTVRFTSKTDGEGSLQVTANSLLYNAASENVFTGTPVPVSVLVSAPPVKTPAPAPLAPKTAPAVQGVKIENTSAASAPESREATTPVAPETTQLSEPVKDIAGEKTENTANLPGLGDDNTASSPWWSSSIFIGFLVVLSILLIYYLLAIPPKGREAIKKN